MNLLTLSVSLSDAYWKSALVDNNSVELALGYKKHMCHNTDTTAIAAIYSRIKRSIDTVGVYIEDYALKSDTIYGALAIPPHLLPLADALVISAAGIGKGQSFNFIRSVFLLRGDLWSTKKFPNISQEWNGLYNETILAYAYLTLRSRRKALTKQQVITETDLSITVGDPLIAYQQLNEKAGFQKHIDYDMDFVAKNDPIFSLFLPASVTQG